MASVAVNFLKLYMFTLPHPPFFSAAFKALAMFDKASADFAIQATMLLGLGKEQRQCVPFPPSQPAASRDHFLTPHSIECRGGQRKIGRLEPGFVLSRFVLTRMEGHTGLLWAPRGSEEELLSKPQTLYSLSLFPRLKHQQTRMPLIVFLHYQRQYSPCFLRLLISKGK